MDTIAPTRKDKKRAVLVTRSIKVDKDNWSKAMKICDKEYNTTLSEYLRDVVANFVEKEEGKKNPHPKQEKLIK